MNIFVVKWPNGTISITGANTVSQLFDILDTEDNPEGAKIYKLEPDEYNRFHITTEVVNNKIKVDTNSELDNKLKLQKNIFKTADWQTEL